MTKCASLKYFSKSCKMNLNKYSFKIFEILLIAVFHALTIRDTIRQKYVTSTIYGVNENCAALWIFLQLKDWMYSFRIISVIFALKLASKIVHYTYMLYRNSLKNSSSACLEGDSRNTSLTVHYYQPSLACLIS